jgi:hypothetical protein
MSPTTRRAWLTRPTVVVALAATALVSPAMPAEAHITTCRGHEVTIFEGSRGDDVIQGTDGDDVIHARGGNDIIYAGGGDDIVCGGTGDDAIFGGEGNDVLIGGRGNDRIVGDSGSDDIRGNAGTDHLDGASGADVVRAGSGDDLVLGGTGNDLLIGSRGHDRIRGEGGHDDIRGNAGDDRLYGQIGTDITRGGPGSDACGAETDRNCEMRRRWGHEPDTWRDFVEEHFGAISEEIGAPALVEEAMIVMACESKGEPFAENPYSSAAGLFQFLDGTWERWNPRTDGWAGESVFHPEANIATAARLVLQSVREDQDRWWQWSCKPY